jgi:integrase
MSEATLAKHLRQLAACWAAAMENKHTNENPTKFRAQRPTSKRKDDSYFTDSELAALWATMQRDPMEWLPKTLTEEKRITLAGSVPLIFHLCRIGAWTGCRKNELLSLRWRDLHLDSKRLEVARSWNPFHGETTPKGRKTRTVNLTEPALKIVGSWINRVGVQDDDEFMFPTDRHNSKRINRDVLYPAMEAAGIPRIGEGGGVRTFHSFCNTFAR